MQRFLSGKTEPVQSKLSCETTYRDEEMPRDSHPRPLHLAMDEIDFRRHKLHVLRVSVDLHVLVGELSSQPQPRLLVHSFCV